MNQSPIPNQLNAANYLNLARDYFHQGNIPAALEICQNAIKFQPDFFPAYTALGHILQSQNQLLPALRAFAKAVEINPNLPEVFGQMGDICANLAQWETAINHYRQALILYPPAGSQESRESRLRVDLNLGKALVETNQWQEAANCFRQCLEIDPKMAVAWFNLGLVLEQQNQLDAAVDCYRKAVEIQPDLAAGCCNLARGLEAKGDLDAAVTLYHRSFQLQPDLIKSYFQQHVPPKVTCPQTEQNRYLSRQVCHSLAQLATSQTDIIYHPIHPLTTVGLYPPQTTGEIHQEFCLTQANFPSSFVAVLPEGRAWGDFATTAVMTTDNQLLAEVNSGHPALIFALDNLPPVTRFAGTVAFLSIIGGDTYYHWMMDILPRLELLRRCGMDWADIDYFIINQNNSQFQRESLAALGINQDKLLASYDYSYIQAERLVVPSIPATIPKAMAGFTEGVPPWVCQFLRDAFLPGNFRDVSPHERIYIRRNNAKYRRVLNEGEVMAVLSPLGFTAVSLESLSFGEQVALMAGSNVIVAPHGAGLTNVVFCQPHAKIIELFPVNFINNYYWLLSAQVGLEYYYCVGNSPQAWYSLYPQDWRHGKGYIPPRGEDILVDIDELLAVLRLADLR
ncbi:MAG TPA: DUF563 domain-containing protein [Oscillatoriaceae cyanobacterium M33_DOE_052]|uniref:DUF563 domain-containing protein n=1 Tax=Planktothricoides sp. SpSt-374 TaxID=2282167 RepID=A0A7C3VGS2_9CYAN|nr:DUF563 domain-containing protein [Oscillatoriaceae cyanobacterium M33_DOE_052]